MEPSINTIKAVCRGVLTLSKLDKILGIFETISEFLAGPNYRNACHR